MTLSIFKALTTTYSVVFQNLAIVLRIAWLPAAVLTVTNAWISLKAFELEAAIAPLPVDAAPERVLEAAAPHAAAIFPLLAVALLASAVLTSGFLKWILRGEEQGLFYAALGADEVRLFASWILVGVVLLGVYAAALLGMGIAVAALAQASASLAETAGAMLGGVVVVLMLYSFARLSLVGPVVIRDEKVSLAAGWRLSRGNGWRLAAFWALTIVPLYALASLFTMLFVPGYLSYLSQGPEGEQALTQILRERMGVMSAAGYVVNLPIWAIMASAGGVALRILTGAGLADGASRSPTAG